MKIRYCDFQGVVVEMSKIEFQELTGFRIGDSYGNHGAREGACIGKDFDLKLAFEKIYALKVAHETKARVKKNLLDCIAEVDKALWPIPYSSETQGE